MKAIKRTADQEIVASNVGKAVIKVNHQDLQRADSESLYRSFCPKCRKGLLMVRRDLKSGELLEDDYCLLCGQHFFYKDFAKLKKKGKLL